MVLLFYIVFLLYGLMFFKLLSVLSKKNILDDDDIHEISSFYFEHKRYLKEKYKNKD